MTRARPLRPRAWRRFLRSATGGATVEFVIVFPLFVAIFMSSFEASMLLIRQLMLDRALDVTMREVRVSPGQTFPRDIMRRDICDAARILPDCETSLVVEITPIGRQTYALPNGGATCVERGGAALPGGNHTSGVPDQLMLVRACYTVRPFFPSSILGTELVRDSASEGEYSIAAASAFSQEPGRTTINGFTP